ncbi:unnamed protein product [Peniophora sp. CBMAI 1063]|nr:unnamed protein product [Peniophora sp. CBMAI 1063]
MTDSDIDMEYAHEQPALALDDDHTWAKVADLALRHLARVGKPPTHPDDASLEDRFVERTEAPRGDSLQLVNHDAHIPPSVRVPQTWSLIITDMRRVCTHFARRLSDFYVAGTNEWVCPMHDCMYAIAINNLSVDEKKVVDGVTRGADVPFYTLVDAFRVTEPAFIREVIDIVALEHYESVHLQGLRIHHVIHGQDHTGRIMYYWQLNRISAEFLKKTVRGWEARRFEEIRRTEVQRALASEARQWAEGLIRDAKQGDKDARLAARIEYGDYSREGYAHALCLERRDGLFDARVSAFEGPAGGGLERRAIRAMRGVHSLSFERRFGKVAAAAERDGILERVAQAKIAEAPPLPLNEALAGDSQPEAEAASVLQPTISRPQKNHPLLHWIPERMAYLWALLRLNGRPAQVLSGEVWLYGEWIPVSLRQLGLTVQLGHWAGDRCSLQRHVNDRFVVVHTNGIHQVRVAFCGCSRTKVARRDQVLAARWFPATIAKPKTAATLEVLEQFDAHSAAGKDNAYDFYNTLEHITDGAGIFHLPDRSKDFLRMAHKHRHLLALKRGGRGHDPLGGIERTQYGELAVLCPACPHKGINTEGVVDLLRRLGPELAEGHETFNDTVHLAMDCNFRAKNRMTRSTPETSPYLGDGMAYMVPEAAYDHFTSNSAHDAEMSSCSRFGATILANLKNGKGLRTTGIGAVFCARHEFFCANSIGTLIKGERYCTMDFILAAALRRVRASSLRLYYDIVCQYTRNLNLRMLEVEPKLFIYAGAQKLLHKLHVTFGIPKFHNPGHLVMCQLYFNLSFIKGTGNTDGEASERAWAGLNPAASSLREMGPGTMRDTIDFFCSAWNWRKFVNMSASLCRNMEIALAAAMEHCEMYSGLLGAVRAENPGTASEWTQQGVDYEGRQELDDMGRPITSGGVTNPYESRSQKQSLEKARLQSASIAAAAQQGAKASETEKTAADKNNALTNFIVLAFKIEVWQRRATIATEGRTYIQKRERLEQATELERQIRLFRKEQQWIMPAIHAAVQELEGMDSTCGTTADYESDEDGEEGEATTKRRPAMLYLPSDLDQPLARTMLDVLLQEMKLRFAAMEDWLDILRQQLRVRGTVRQWKVVFSSGQRMATRTINKQRVIQENIDQARNMYRWHRERYATLVSFLSDEEREQYVFAEWEDLFEELADEDCRPLNNSLLIAINARRSST